MKPLSDSKFLGSSDNGRLLQICLPTQAGVLVTPGDGSGSLRGAVLNDLGILT